MRTLFKILIILAIILLSIQIKASDPPPPPPPNGGNPSGSPVGGGAPLGKGTLSLMLLAGFYGIKKIRKMNKEASENPASKPD